MSNHPNRSRRADNAARNPTPAEIRAAREATGLTQSTAAEAIYSTLRTWQDWEAGVRRMHPGLFEFFLAKTGQIELTTLQFCLNCAHRDARIWRRRPCITESDRPGKGSHHPGAHRPDRRRTMGHWPLD